MVAACADQPFMNNSDPFKFFLSTFAMQLPILLVSLVACVTVLIRWKQTSRGALWALMGFGLAFILCFAIPIGQAVVQHWAMQSGDFARRAPVFTALAVLWSVLRAVTYIFLLVAVLAGRSTADAAIPPAISRH
jgi:hypothetical protein